MSLPDPPPARKLSRLGLLIPFGLTIALAIAWSVAWFVLRGQAESRMDAAVARVAKAGYALEWKERTFAGFPFRMNVTLTEFAAREPSGWALQAPRLEAQAYLHAPTHWVVAAPDGVTFVRPVGGPVRVTGKTIRASLSHLAARPPSFSFQGLGLAFEAGPGANPFGLTAAEKVEFHLRAGPDDEGGVFLTVEKGTARLSGLLGRIAGDKPVSLSWNSTLSKMSAFKGPDWPSAVRNWTADGGRMTVRQAGITAGDALIGVNAGTLSAGSDGRLRGVLQVGLRQAPRALGVMGETGTIEPDRAEAAAAVAAARESGDQARATINFEAGQTTLGPVAIAPAPIVYRPRR